MRFDFVLFKLERLLDDLPHAGPVDRHGCSVEQRDLHGIFGRLVASNRASQSTRPGQKNRIGADRPGRHDQAARYDNKQRDE